MKWTAVLLLLGFLIAGCHHHKEHHPRQVDLGLQPSAREEVAVPARMSLAHPYVMAHAEDWEKIRALCSTDAHAQELHQLLRRDAEQFLAKPLAVASSQAMLVRAREVLKRVPMLAGLYKIDGDKRYRDHAIEEMVAAAKLDRWDPDTFLAASEMMTAVAVGYDWLHDELDPRDQRLISEALITKGLVRGLTDYDSRGGWTTANHNWNLVCNGGLTVAALAVYDDEPRIAREVLADARRSIQNGLASYQPDGGWLEGPMYWNYATKYAVFYFAALQSAGQPARLDKQGFGQTGFYRLYVTGPTGKTFNYGDSDEITGNCPSMFWLANAFRQPAFASFHERLRVDEASIFDLLWYRPTYNEHEKLPLARKFEMPGMVSLRSGWSDPNATFIAAKAGTNQAHHGHYDLGTFVIDMLGERWACDLGADNYDLPDYFGKARGNYLRCSTRGHNTITFDNANQSAEGTGEILKTGFDSPEPWAILDLSDGYDDVKSYLRGVRVLADHSVLIDDEFNTEERPLATWRLYTPAQVSTHGGTATLELNGKRVRVVALSPTGVKWDARPVTTRRPEKPADGVTCLSISTRDSGNDKTPGRIVIWITPDPDSQPPVLSPMRNWR